MLGETRSAPPGLNMSTDAGLAVMLNQIEGHAAMYDAVHAHDSIDADGDGQTADVGIALNMVALTPKEPGNEADELAMRHVDYLYHCI